MRKNILRILYLITDLGKGGAERYLIDLCTELQRRDNIEFIIASLFPSNEYKELTKNFSIVQINYPGFKLSKRNEYPIYKKLLEDFKPHIIHTHRFLGEFLSSFYVQPQVKYFCHCHDNMIQFRNLSFQVFFSKVNLLNFFEKLFLIKSKYRKKKTIFITNSSHTHQYYKNVLPEYLKKEIRQINYGFNYNKFYKKKTMAFSKDQPLKIINVGSFQNKKNQIFIVDIAKKLKQLKVDFEINLLGDGPNRARVESEVLKHGLEQQIIFHGLVDKVEEWLWTSHIYLHTAWYEPFGLVFLEAMAAGLPCVALNGKGNKDLIISGKNGYIINEENAKLFAERIIEISSNSDKYLEIAQFGQNFAKNYDIKRATDNLVSLYKSDHN